jgi:hypothetical protein
MEEGAPVLGRHYHFYQPAAWAGWTSRALQLPATPALFEAGPGRSRARNDKHWKTRDLTDCASFVATERWGLSEALTTGDHSVQAGFRTMLLEDAPDAP